MEKWDGTQGLRDVGTRDMASRGLKDSGQAATHFRIQFQKWENIPT